MQKKGDFEHIIIGGMKRSGTSLMRAILGSHSNVGLLMLELPFWTSFNLIYRGKKMSLKKAELVLDEILQHFTITMGDVEFEKPFLQNRLKRINEDILIEDIYFILLEYYREKRGKEKTGLKTPNNELYADDIFKTFPQTKFIHVIRNPLDQAVSLKKAKETWWSGRVNHYVNINEWETSVEMAEVNSVKFRNNYLIVRYEDIAANTEETIIKVCEFLGLSYEPEMLSGMGHPGWRGNNSSFSKSTNKGVNSDSINRYKKELTKEEINLYGQLLGEHLKNMGYEEGVQVGKEKVWDTFKYSFYRKYEKAKRNISRILKSSIFFKSIRALKELLGLSHPNFMEKATYKD